MSTWPKHQGSLRGAFATDNAIVHQGRLDSGVLLLTKRIGSPNWRTWSTAR